MPLQKHKFCTIRKYIAKQIMSSKSTLSKTCSLFIIYSIYHVKKLIYLMYSLNLKQPIIYNIQRVYNF